MKKILFILIMFLSLSCEKEIIRNTATPDVSIEIKGSYLISVTDIVDDAFITYVNGYVLKVDQTTPEVSKGQIIQLNFDELNYTILNE